MRPPSSQIDLAPTPGQADEAAAYVAELGGELATLARNHQLPFLAHLLDLAVMEAREQARAPKGKAQKPRDP